MSTSALDVLCPAGKFPFFVTVSPARSSPLSDADISAIKEWHKAKGTQVLLVKEIREDGTPHLHSALTSVNRAAGNLTRSLTRVFVKHSIPYVKGVTIRIKSVPEMIGLYHYLLKDVAVDNPIIYLKGWKLTWMRKQCLDNLSKMPHKMLASEQHHLTSRTATSCVIKYAKLRDMPLGGKQCFKEVIYQMMSVHYDFSAVRMPQLYAQVSALSKNRVGVMSWLDNQLFNLD